ncbi:MAG: AAA family ATPase [Chitinophagales bacterium]|nr:AAA family ATPase [Chitinophagales bacterium]
MNFYKSTAEVYSELNKKPLYIVQVDEIGISPDKIEQNLNHIFRRVEKWNAIILFDEVDVFLSKRGDNIEKSAIVGIFLRLMDYFRGMMFFTTNRSEVIDDAVLSRITLNIKYPDLTDDVRKLIWKSKLESAGLYIDSMDELIKINLNGRQIRNMVRLGKIIFDDKINEQKFIDLIHNSVPKSEK